MIFWKYIFSDIELLCTLFPSNNNLRVLSSPPSPPPFCSAQVVFCIFFDQSSLCNLLCDICWCDIIMQYALHTSLCEISKRNILFAIFFELFALYNLLCVNYFFFAIGFLQFVLYNMLKYDLFNFVTAYPFPLVLLLGSHGRPGKILALLAFWL